MTIRVRFYSQLRDSAGLSELDLNMPETARVSDLLEALYTAKPALRSHDNSILVGAGLEFVDRDYLLKPGEEIAIMPPVQGG